MSDNELGFFYECVKDSKNYPASFPFYEASSMDIIKEANKIRREFNSTMNSYRRCVMINDLKGAKSLLEDAELTITALGNEINEIPDGVFVSILNGVIIPTCTAMISLFVSTVITKPITVKFPTQQVADMAKPLLNLAGPMLGQLQKMGSTIMIGNCVIEGMKVLNTLFHGFKAMTAVNPDKRAYELRKMNTAKDKCVNMLMEFKYEVRAMKGLLEDVEKDLAGGDKTSLYNLQSMTLRNIH